MEEVINFVWTKIVFGFCWVMWLHLLPFNSHSFFIFLFSYFFGFGRCTQMEGQWYRHMEGKRPLKTFMVGWSICLFTWELMDLSVVLWVFWLSLKKTLAAVILPSLQQLHYDLVELDDGNNENLARRSFGKKRLEGDGVYANLDSERDDECGICLEPCTKMVVPNCCHAMCINCYRDW